MKVHAIKTGTVAVHERQREGAPGALRVAKTLFDREWTDPLPIYAWLIEHPEGLICVDTGETARVSEPGYQPRWHPYFRLGVREWVEPEEEVGPAIRALGFDPADVRTVVMTHLHTDHAGGLEHFPNSEILVSSPDLKEAGGPLGKLKGFLPHRWPEWFDPKAIELAAESFGPFERRMTLTDAGDVHVIPTPGHTGGHVSVVVEDGDSVIFLAGDTSYTQELMTKGAIDGVCPDPKAAADTLARINELAAERPTVYLPTHDPESGARLAERRPVR